MRLSRTTVVMLLLGAVGAVGVARRLHRHWPHLGVASAVARSGPTWNPPPLAIPNTHPRLWFTGDRLARGRSWAKKNPFRPRDDNPEEEALAYLLEGDRAAGMRAVDWLMRLNFDTSGVASDQARWNGEEAMEIFDWCHDLLSSVQRQLLVSRWNDYIDTLDRKSWGGVGMEGNNYYWGYLRNAVEWGIVSAHENPLAEQLLNYGLGARFGRSFVPYASGPGRGGVLPEGSQYGPYLVDYATVPFVTTTALGADVWNASGFFKEAIFYLVYATTPAPTTTVGGSTNRFELFPFDDDEIFLEEGGSAEKPELSTFVLAASEQWRNAPVGQYARAWLDQVSPRLSHKAAAWADPTPARSRPFTDLPLDYFAPGAGALWARNQWGKGASILSLQLGIPEGTGHQHVDWGTFQLWRAGRWLSRETVGYNETFAGWGGPGASAGSRVGASSALAHNTVLFEGMGARNTGNRRGPPRILRVESRPSYAYAAVELTDSYRCSRDECRPERDENFYAGSVVREFVYLRPLEAVVIFDRLEASDERKPAAEVVKTFLLHTETKPVADGGNRLLAQNGGQALRVFTLLPAKETPRIVAEGGKIGQYRTEIDAHGPALSYFLNVLQARGDGEPDLRVSLQEGTDDFTLKVVHPTRGSAVVVFEKGKASHGGKLGFAASGEPAPAALGEAIQGISVSDSGPRWQ